MRSFRCPLHVSYTHVSSMYALLPPPTHAHLHTYHTCTHIHIHPHPSTPLHTQRRPDEDRFLRLLEILGEYSEKGKVIIFVQSQERADHLFRDLLRVCCGVYVCEHMMYVWACVCTCDVYMCTHMMYTCAYIWCMLCSMCVHMM